MPIILPDGLPATASLLHEGLSVLDDSHQVSASTPAFRIALVNLMPAKTITEIQFARMLASTPNTVQLDLVVPDSYQSKTTSDSYLDQFYQRWSTVKDVPYDGLIVSGAPIEHLPYDLVHYWTDMTDILDWAHTHVPSSYYVCWAAQAALWHFHGVPKHDLMRKMFGVFGHSAIMPSHPLLKGLDQGISVPVSRHTTIRRRDLPQDSDLQVLLESELSGLGMIDDPANRAIYMFNHFEYDSGTLNREYSRDLRIGRDIDMPRHYFPGDDVRQMPKNTWRQGAIRFFSNWLDLLETNRAVNDSNLAA